jgi:hypothetical protein
MANLMPRRFVVRFGPRWRQTKEMNVMAKPEPLKGMSHDMDPIDLLDDDQVEMFMAQQEKSRSKKKKKKCVADGGPS